MTKFPMTKEGVQALQIELDHLKKVERRSIIEAIAEARSHGDLKENAEYHAAKEKQGFIEGRINEIESKLDHANIIDVTKFKNTGKVVFGATITIVNLHNDSETTYKIVSEDEADLKQNKISFTSPIARALIAKNTGDIIEVDTPNGLDEYEILKVEYI